jgi:hypothetical protein
VSIDRAWHHARVTKAAKPAAKKKPVVAQRKPAAAKRKPAAPKRKPAAPKKKPAVARKKSAATAAMKKPAAPKNAAPAVARKPAPRADLGAPVDGFFARQPPHLRPILDELRRLVNEAAPDSSSSLKWGMPFYMIGENTLCALAGFKAHVNLILPGPPGTYADPDGRLEGDGKTGKHLKLRALEELPRETVAGWLRTAAGRART